MKNLVLFTFLIFSLSIKAQIVEGVSSLGLDQYPHTTLKMSGIGSRGFEDYTGIYNHTFPKEDSLIKISISGISNLPILRTFKVGKEDINYFVNKLDFLPQANLSLILNESKTLALTINYFSDVLSSVKFGDKSGSTIFQFQTDKGTFEVIVDKDNSNFYAKSSILQFYLSYLLNENFSLSLGAQTTGFDYVFKWAPLEPITFENSLFNKAQIIASLNYQFNNEVFSYMTFKSQKSNILMSKFAEYNGEEILTSDVYLSLHGNIGYGIKYQISDIASLSAEFSHQFLEVDTLVDYKYYTKSVLHHIWNNEIILGTKIKVLENFYSGLMLSYYLRYNNDKYVWYASDMDPFTGTKVPPSKPFTLVASLQYQLGNYNLYLQYQHSRTTYINKGSYGNKEMYDYGNFFKLTLQALIPSL